MNGAMLVIQSCSRSTNSKPKQSMCPCTITVPFLYFWLLKNIQRIPRMRYLSQKFHCCFFFQNFTLFTFCRYFTSILETQPKLGTINNKTDRIAYLIIIISDSCYNFEQQDEESAKHSHTSFSRYFT